MAKLRKQETGYTQVKNEVLNDSNLSLKAKGIFAYLFSKPDGWDFAADRIALDQKDGRRSVLVGLKELENRGYLNRQRLSSGRVEYYLKFSLDINPKCGNSTVAKPHSAETAPVSNTEKISNKDIIVTKERSTSFIPPSLSEIKSYCEERANGINPQSFLDFYSSKGWMIGRNKMKDWRAAIRTWENRSKPQNKTGNKYIGI